MTVETEPNIDRGTEKINVDWLDQNDKEFGLINQSMMRDTSTMIKDRSESIVDIVKKRLETIKPYETAIKMLRKMPQL